MHSLWLQQRISPALPFSLEQGPARHCSRATRIPFPIRNCATFPFRLPPEFQNQARRIIRGVQNNPTALIRENFQKGKRDSRLAKS